MKKEPFNIFVDPKQHCLYPRWYCRLMFWRRHGSWTMKRIFITLKELRRT